MTRLAIVGSSHIGAIRLAATRVLAERPGLKTGWFAQPGAVFRRLRVNDNGVLHIPSATPGEKALSYAVNGGVTFDLKPFDHIWIVGNRFARGWITQMFLERDVLEWPRTGNRRSMSQAFAELALRVLVDAACGRIEQCFGRDPRVVVTPGPYFGENAATDGVGNTRWMATICRHPNAARIEDMFETAIRECMAARGLQVMLQPAATRAPYMATRAKYLQDARDFRDRSRRLNDQHHMNAEFGYDIFSAFAELHLGKA